MVRSTLIIVKKSPDIMDAKKQAEDIYNEYFPHIHPYIVSVQIVILREMFLPEGNVGYLMRVSIEAKPVDTMPALLKEILRAGEIRIS